MFQVEDVITLTKYSAIGWVGAKRSDNIADGTITSVSCPMAVFTTKQGQDSG